MYNAFFELDKAPFSMTPDPAFLFLTAKHREALAGLLLAVAGRKGFLVLTGEAGTGKTTLLSRTLRFISRDRVQFSFIINPTLSPSEFLEMAMIDFGIEDIPASKAQRLVHLQRFLLEGHRAGKTSVLVIDEAHKLTPEVLEEVRLLTNFETSGAETPADSAGRTAGADRVTKPRGHAAVEAAHRHPPADRPVAEQ